VINPPQRGEAPPQSAFAKAYKKAAKFRFYPLLAEGVEPKFNGSFYQKKEKKK
jgi:hypothetical protein